MLENCVIETKSLSLSYQHFIYASIIFLLCLEELIVILMSHSSSVIDIVKNPQERCYIIL
jgi:hypothetical protein